MSCLAQLNHVAKRLCKLETCETLLYKRLGQLIIMLIYARFFVKRPRVTSTCFLNKSLNFARLFARLMPVFLQKKCPSLARLFSKMSPSEELQHCFTIISHDIQLPARYRVFFNWFPKKRQNLQTGWHLKPVLQLLLHYFLFLCSPHLLRLPLLRN